MGGLDLPRPTRRRVQSYAWTGCRSEHESELFWLKVCDTSGQWLPRPETTDTHSPPTSAHEHMSAHTSVHARVRVHTHTHTHTQYHVVKACGFTAVRPTNVNLGAVARTACRCGGVGVGVGVGAWVIGVSVGVGIVRAKSHGAPLPLRLPMVSSGWPRLASSCDKPYTRWAGLPARVVSSIISSPSRATHGSTRPDGQNERDVGGLQGVRSNDRRARRAVSLVQGGWPRAWQARRE